MIGRLRGVIGLPRGVIGLHWGVISHPGGVIRVRKVGKGLSASMAGNSLGPAF